MNYILKFLTASDIDMVMQMNMNFWDNLADYNSAIRYLKNNANFILAAIKDDIVIGFAYGYKLNRLNCFNDMMYVHAVEVMAKYRRQGVAYDIFINLKSYCKLNNIEKIFLTCYQNNAPANCLYKKLGGEVPKESSGNDTVYWFQIT